jgi:hypothetical protein
MSKKMEAKMHMKSSTLKLLDFSQIPSNFLEISNNFNLRKLRDDSINIMVKNLE